MLRDNYKLSPKKINWAGILKMRPLICNFHKVAITLAMRYTQLFSPPSKPLLVYQIYLFRITKTLIITPDTLISLIRMCLERNKTKVHFF